ncbi:hypothetical protein PPL_06188 [Heterostelium album PN500]|uniref:Uncharacterized protein n=1 Tax=Heterostelium pallidum (strain ATCC 26659 / Pp 5 / PN500) TaxID=670386 RepID=D3BCG3_HETP5|nr:hypothetical protein PPL_06188 [Heterostelium album PN500]EFA80953.1 hypothetical protein PPL_06188 [Heterostelium album PN500]|eukprot:XP_020433071.1 hypothetical protein PPL_06188 [Heterostelium album PN500]
MDQSLFTVFGIGDFEDITDMGPSGWSYISNGTLFTYTPTGGDPTLVNQPFEGSCYVQFQNESNIIETAPILFANLTPISIYNKLYLQFYLFIIEGETNSSSLIIKLNDTQVAKVDQSTPVSNNITSKYQYRLISIDLTDYANGTHYQLTIQYDQGESSPGNDTIYLVDYITFLSATTNPPIASNIYISSSGDDTKGDGSIDKPFCSLQRAINLIESGYSVYLLSDIEVQSQSFGLTYIFDTLGKNITIEGYGSGYSIEQSKTFALTRYAIITGGQLTVNQLSWSKSFTPNYGQASLFTVSAGSSLIVSNSNLTELQAYIADNVTAIAHLQLDSNCILTNCTINVCLGDLFYSIGNNLTLNAITFLRNEYGAVFVLDNPSSNLSLTNSSFRSSFNVFLVFNMNMIYVYNITFADAGYFQKNDYISGGTLIIDQCSFLRNALMVNFNNIQHTIISNTVYTSSQFTSQPLINIRNTIVDSLLEVSNVTFSLSLATSNPIISIQSAGSNYFNNSAFVSNLTPLMKIIHTNITFDNITIAYNSKSSVLFTIVGGTTDLLNMNVLENEVPLISSTGASLNINASLFFQNTNQQYISIPFISLIKPNIVNIYNVTVMFSYNFQFIYMTNGQQVSIDTINFFNNSIAELILASYTKLVVSTIKATDNFLATKYPIEVDNCDFTLYFATFSRNTQFLLITNSQFAVSYTYWSTVSTVDGMESFSILNSTGSFYETDIDLTIPSTGLYVVNSYLNLTETFFTNLNAYDTPVGYYLNSTIYMAEANIEGNSAGNNMMTFQDCSLTILNSNFYNLTSPTISIFNIVTSNVYISDSYFNGNSGGTGIKLTNSFARIEKTMFDANVYTIGYLFDVVGGTLILDDCEVQANQGGFQVLGNSVVEPTTFIVKNTYFEVNHPENQLFNVESIELNIYNCIFSSNGSPHSVAIIQVAKSVLVMDLVTFYNHELYAEFSSSIAVQTSSVTITNSKFSQNGGMYGVLYFDGNTDRLIEISGCTFDMNFAISGSAISAFNSQMISVMNSTFSSNSANQPYSTKESIDINNCGGAITLVNSNMWSNNNNYSFNNAGQNGGVVYVALNSYSLHTNDIFNSNTVSYGSGACCYDDTNSGRCAIGTCDTPESCVTTKNNTIIDNYAIFGPIYASGPVRMNISLVGTTTIQPNTTFVIQVALYDAYKQIISVLRESISVQVIISKVVDDNLVFISKVYTESTQQGWVQYSLSLDIPIGLELVFQANTTNRNFSSTLRANSTGCLPGYFPEITSGSCEICPVGTYGWDGQTCYLCSQIGMEKVRCPGGNTITTMPGFYLLPDVYPPDIYECAPTICEFNQCREHQYGLLCSKCENDYFKVKSYCEYCPEGSMNYLLVVGILLFFTAYFLFLSIYKIPSGTVLFNFLVCVQMISVISFDIRYVAILPLFNFQIDFWPTNLSKWLCMVGHCFDGSIALFYFHHHQYNLPFGYESVVPLYFWFVLYLPELASGTTQR